MDPGRVASQATVSSFNEHHYHRHLYMTPRIDPLAALPEPVILRGIFPHLTTKEIFLVCRTSKTMYRLLDNDAFWMARTAVDFPNCPAFLLETKHSRPGWCRRVYLGLRHPRPFIWGIKAALTNPHAEPLEAPQPADPFKHATWGWMDTPCEVTSGFPVHATDNGVHTFYGAISGIAMADSNSFIPWHQDSYEKDKGFLHSIDLVEWHACGHGFVARDSRGGLWGFGKLSTEGKLLSRPTAIPFPMPVADVTAGPTDVLVLDEDNSVFQLPNWDTALHEAGHNLYACRASGHGPLTPRITQLAVGHQYAACLMEQSRVCVWMTKGRQPHMDDWNFYIPRQAYEFTMGHLDKYEDSFLSSARMLPVIPSFDLEEEHLDHDSCAAGERIVKIACGREFIAALKQNGEVWVAYPQERVPTSWTWRYMPYFSGPDTTHLYVYDDVIATHSTPISISATHWTPSYLRFGWFDPDTSVRESFQPAAFTSLPVVDVALGHFHYSALTATGEVYTWGCNLSPNISVDHRNMVRRMTPVRQVPFVDQNGAPVFVYAITAGTRHAGALALGDNRIQIYAPPVKDVPEADAPRALRHKRTGSRSTLHRKFSSLSLSSQISWGTLPPANGAATPTRPARSDTADFIPKITSDQPNAVKVAPGNGNASPTKRSSFKGSSSVVKWLGGVFVADTSSASVTTARCGMCHTPYCLGMEHHNSLKLIKYDDGRVDPREVFLP